MLSRRSFLNTLAVASALLFATVSYAAPSGRAAACNLLFNSHENEIDRKALADYLVRPQPMRSLLQVSANRAHGMTWTSALTESQSFHPKFSSPKELYEAKERPHLNYAAETDETAYFPARFTVVPIHFIAREVSPELGVPENALMFNMSLPDSEVSKYFGGTLRQFKFPHLQDSFAYIRFYMLGDDLVITEIQSELFRHVRGKDLNPGYKHWAPQLLQAFEHYAMNTFYPSHPQGRILIAGSDYQLRRWRNLDDGRSLAPGLARILYRDLPQKHGYKETAIDLALEWPGHLGSDDALILEQIRSGFVISLKDLAQAKRRNLKFQLLHGGSQYQAALAFQSLQRPRGEAKRLNPQLIDETLPATAVYYTRLPETMLYADRGELQPLHQSLLQRLPHWTNGFLRKTPVSLAIADTFSTIEEPLSGFGVTLTYHHWPSSDRHPLMFLNGNDVLSFKGAGRRTLNDDTKTFKRQTFAAQESETESHRVWGGLTETQGRVEFLNHLWLHKLARDAGFAPAIGIPVDVGWMEQVPKRTKQGVQLIPMREFLHKDLATSPERLVQFRSFTTSPYRVFVIPQILQSRGATVLIRPVLESLYLSYGEKFIWIEPTDALAIGDQPNHPAIYKFLDRIYKANRAAADRIMRQFAFRTLQTMGFVHALGGHLGGHATNIFSGEGDAILMTPKFLGAPSGGAPQLRNVTLAGEYRDLDTGVHIPGAPLSDWPKHQDILKENLIDFQRQDLRHWQETWYQFSSFVRGKPNVPAGTQFPQFAWGDPTQWESLLSVPYGTTPQEKLIRAYLDRDLEAHTVVRHRSRRLDQMFLDAKLQRLYDDGRSRAFHIENQNISAEKPR